MSRITEHTAVARLARRMARTGGWRHLLVVGLIALSVATAVGVAITNRSSDLPEQVDVATQMGAADVRLTRWVGGIGFEELPAELQRFVRRIGAPIERADEVDVTGIVREAIPDAEILRADDRFGYAQGVPVSLLSLDVSDPLAEGLLRIQGPAPEAGEALASPSLLRKLDAAVGDTIELPGGMRATVVGTAEDPHALQRTLAVLPPEAAAGGRTTETRWFVRSPGGIAPTAVERLHRAFHGDPTAQEDEILDGRANVNVTARSDVARQVRFEHRRLTTTPTFVGAVVGALLLLQVAFVSAAAFATGARRRLRDLGLLGSTGASPRQIRALVMWEAAVLGAVGAIAGVMIGVLGATVLGPTVAERVVGRMVPALQFHLADLLVPAVLGMLAAIAAAYLPARTAGRVPVTTALAGRLPIGRVPGWIAPLAVGASGLGLVLLAAVVRSDLRGSRRDLLLGAAVVGAVVGAAALGSPLLGALGRFADRLPARMRLAVRDTVRQRTRSAAAVAALTVVLVVPVIAAVSATTDAARFAPSPDLRRDLVTVAGPHYASLELPPTPAMLDAAEAQLPRVEERVQIQRLADLSADADVGVRIVPAGDRPAPVTHIHQNAAHELGFGTQSLAIATPDLLTAIGLDGAGAELDDRSALLLQTADIRYGVTFGDGTVAIDVQHFGPRPPDEPTTSAVIDLRVIETDLATGGLPSLLVTEGLADELGLEPVDGAVLLDLVGPVAPAQVEQLEETSHRALVPFSVAGHVGARPDYRGVIAAVVGGALLVALVISAMTAALAATESDHDLELITAVGAAPSVRRRFHGWQAGYHALLAALLAVPTGLLIYRAGVIRRAEEWMVVPWGWLAAVIVAVPLVVGLGHAGLMRSARLRAPRRIA